MTSSSSPPIVQHLEQALLDAIGPRVPPHGRYALVDFPRYANAGDSAIWLGTLACLAALDAPPPTYIACEKTMRPAHLRSLVGDGTIFIQGGGSFGDVWPARQVFREAVLKAFPERPIVQLPQTVHFQHEEALAATRKVLRAHPAFTLMVRDAASLRIAEQELGVPAQLVPDMAFALRHLPRRAPAAADLVWIRRVDVESRLPAELHDPTASMRQCDWPDDSHTLRWRRMKRRSRRLSRSTRVTPRGIAGLGRSFSAVGHQRVRGATALLDQGRVVVTDRLHAHIFCLLRGQPHVVLDNSYGKVHGFLDAWTSGAPTVHRAKTVSGALEAARTLAASLA